MSARSTTEVRGFEYDWLASDADGHVGFFSTAGGGHAPEAFLRDPDAHDHAIEAILASPPRGPAVRVRSLPPGFRNPWLEMAERGVFAFDADPNGGPYQRVASPTAPVQASALPAAAAVVARQLRYGHLRFSELEVVSVEALGP
jgi:hypothetical protein